MNGYLLLFPLAILACSVGKEELKTGEPRDKMFTQFVAEIPAYPFPVKMSCRYDRATRNIDLTKYEQYFPKAGRIVAKLNTSFNFSLIIFDFACDYSCPVLYSYNANGMRIDSIQLTPGQCGENPFMSSKEWFLIDENIHIDLVDTTRHYSLNGAKQILDSITIETNNYQLNKQGTFDFVNAKTVLQEAE